MPEIGEFPEPEIDTSPENSAAQAPVVPEASGTAEEPDTTTGELIVVRSEIADVITSQQLALVTEVKASSDGLAGPELRKQITAERTWRAFFGRLFGGSRKSPVDYAETTNYPGVLPYEICFAGERYWRLVTELVGKEGGLDGDGTGQRVLEIGCATGGLLAEIHAKWSEANLTGMDISRSSLEFASRQVPEARCLLGDLNQPGVIEALLGETGEGLDLVVALDVVEHLDDPAKQDALLQAIYQRLKPGGMLIIGMPEQPSGRDGWFKRLFKQIWNKADIDTTHYNKPKPERTDEMLTRAGFDLSRDTVADFGYFPIPAPIGGLMRVQFSANRMVVIKKPTALEGGDEAKD